MRQLLINAFLTGVLLYLLLTVLEVLRIQVASGWPVGLLAALCAALAFWAGPMLTSKAFRQ